MNLESLRDRAALFLMDPNRLIWADAALDEAIRQALDAYSRSCPQVCSAAVAASAGGMLDLSGFAGFTGLLALHYPPENANSARGWALRWSNGAASAQLLNNPIPQPGELVRVVYTAAHSLAGLDGAAATSVVGLDESLLARGAAAYAAQMRGVDRAEGAAPEAGAERLAEWADAQMTAYRAALRELRRQTVYDGMITGGWSEV